MALSFNGSSSKLEWAGALASAFPFTIFGWVKPTSASTSHMAFGSGSSGFELAAFLDGANKAKAFTNAGGSTFAASANALTTIWQPVMCVFTSAGARTIYYGNGAPVTDTTTNAAFSSAHTRFVVGTRPQGDALWFNGDIAHVAAWSAALTQTDFNALAGGAAPNTVASASLIEYWSLATQAATQTGTKGRALAATNTSQASTDPLSSGRTLAAAPGAYSISGNAAGLVVATPTFSAALARMSNSTGAGSAARANAAFTGAIFFGASNLSQLAGKTGVAFSGATNASGDYSITGQTTSGVALVARHWGTGPDSRPIGSVEIVNFA